MSGNKQPDIPTYQSTTTNDGYGNSATASTFTPSDYNKSQMAYVQGMTPKVEAALYDDGSADSQASQYADNLKSLGLKRYNQDVNDTMGNMQANNASRFGSLDNSDYDTNTRTASKQFASTLADLGTQYDANKQNAMSNYQNYYTNDLNSLNNTANSLYGLGTSYMNNALSNNNAINGFNQQSYQNQLAAYNNQQTNNAAMYGATANAIGSAIGSVKK